MTFGMRRGGVVALGCLTIGLVVAGCASKATTANVMKGDWSCSSSSDFFAGADFTVSVGDGTWTTTPAATDAGTAQKGTWKISTGDLLITVDDNDTSWGDWAGSGMPGKDVDVSAWDGLLSWTRSDSESDQAPDSVAVTVDGKDVKIVHTSGDDSADITTTRCTKK